MVYFYCVLTEKAAEIVLKLRLWNANYEEDAARERSSCALKLMLWIFERFPVFFFSLSNIRDGGFSCNNKYIYRYQPINKINTENT